MYIRTVDGFSDETHPVLVVSRPDCEVVHVVLGLHITLEIF